MAKLHDSNGDLPELLTDPLEEDTWWTVLRCLVDVLRDAGVSRVWVEYGFVVERDVAGLPQGQNAEVSLDALETIVRDGLQQGTVERAGGSDFTFRSLGASGCVLLCNDGDIHFGSRDVVLLHRMAHSIASRGLTVHDPTRALTAQAP